MVAQRPHAALRLPILPGKPQHPATGPVLKQRDGDQDRYGELHPVGLEFHHQAHKTREVDAGLRDFGDAELLLEVWPTAS